RHGDRRLVDFVETTNAAFEQRAEQDPSDPRGDGSVSGEHRPAHGAGFAKTNAVEKTARVRPDLFVEEAPDRESARAILGVRGQEWTLGVARFEVRGDRGRIAEPLVTVDQHRHRRPRARLRARNEPDMKTR